MCDRLSSGKKCKNVILIFWLVARKRFASVCYWYLRCHQRFHQLVFSRPVDSCDACEDDDDEEEEDDWSGTWRLEWCILASTWVAWWKQIRASSEIATIANQYCFGFSILLTRAFKVISSFRLSCLFVWSVEANNILWPASPELLLPELWNAILFRFLFRLELALFKVWKFWWSKIWFVWPQNNLFDCSFMRLVPSKVLVWPLSLANLNTFLRFSKWSRTTVPVPIPIPVEDRFLIWKWFHWFYSYEQFGICCCCWNVDDCGRVRLDTDIDFTGTQRRAREAEEEATYRHLLFNFSSCSCLTSLGLQFLRREKKRKARQDISSSSSSSSIRLAAAAEASSLCL